MNGVWVSSAFIVLNILHIDQLKGRMLELLCAWNQLCFCFLLCVLVCCGTVCVMNATIYSICYWCRECFPSFRFLPPRGRGATAAVLPSYPLPSLPSSVSWWGTGPRRGFGFASCVELRSEDVQQLWLALSRCVSPPYAEQQWIDSILILCLDRTSVWLNPSESVIYAQNSMRKPGWIPPPPLLMEWIR